MKKLYPRITLLLAVAATALTGAQSAPPATRPAGQLTPAPLELIAHVQQQLRNIESVQADFVQEKNLTVLKHKLVIRGNFALQKPDKVMWNVHEPVKYAIRVMGDEVTQWDEDTKKVQTIRVGNDPTFKAISEQLQSWFMGNYKELEKSYDVFLISQKPLTFRFGPKQGSVMSKVLSWIEVTFGPEEKNIDRMQVRETGGDVTAMVFSNTRLNQPIPKKTWEIPPR
jgi:outer membrane lipoprotein-sorting protein